MTYYIASASRSGPLYHSRKVLFRQGPNTSNAISVSRTSTEPEATLSDQRQMSENMKVTFPDKPPHMPDKYTWLRRVGYSSNYHVGTCIPSSVLEDACSRLSNGADENSVTDALLRKVLIIKIPIEDCHSPYEQSTMNKEIRTLQKIKGEAYSRSGGQHCAQIVDHYDMETEDKEETGWLVMDTVPLSCDLAAISLFDTRAKLPEALLWLVVTQMYDIFWFLQHDCTPYITHRDLGSSSIVISFPHEQGQNSESAAAKQPKVTLVGFGGSVIEDNNDPVKMKTDALFGNEAIMEDVMNLVTEICNLVKRCYDYSTSIRGTGKIIRSTVVLLDEDAPEEVDTFFRGANSMTSLEELWADIGEFAKKQLEKVGDEEWEELKDLVLEIEKSGGSLRDVVKDVLKGHPAED